MMYRDSSHPKIRLRRHSCILLIAQKCFHFIFKQLTFLSYNDDIFHGDPFFFFYSYFFFHIFIVLRMFLPFFRIVIFHFIRFSWMRSWWWLVLVNKHHHYDGKVVIHYILYSYIAPLMHSYLLVPSLGLVYGL
jgi:hypothetical protein